jgi:hypothetical protein
VEGAPQAKIGGIVVENGTGDRASPMLLAPTAPARGFKAKAGAQRRDFDRIKSWSRRSLR